MPNIAATLKAEISRIARKEIRGEIQSLRKYVTSHRGDIAALKRRTQLLEKELRTAAISIRKRAPERVDEPATSRPFSAKSLAKQRSRLGLSAEGLALLLGTSGQTIYNWEQGKARPRAEHMAALAALKTLKKADAASVLAERSQ